jgi:hypothetical protein
MAGPHFWKKPSASGDLMQVLAAQYVAPAVILESDYSTTTWEHYSDWEALESLQGLPISLHPSAAGYYVRIGWATSRHAGFLGSLTAGDDFYFNYAECFRYIELADDDEDILATFCMDRFAAQGQEYGVVYSGPVMGEPEYLVAPSVAGIASKIRQHTTLTLFDAHPGYRYFVEEAETTLWFEPHQVGNPC